MSIRRLFVRQAVALVIVLVVVLVVLIATGTVTRRSKGATGATEFGGAYMQYDWPLGFGSMTGSQTDTPVFRPDYGIAPAQQRRSHRTVNFRSAPTCPEKVIFFIVCKPKNGKTSH